ncbi:MAG: endonuclease III domain-containing protein, partial [Candidatus Woesearchaeota archaeon]
SMLLYAGRKPIFVIDAYTKRICSRHGICKPDAKYHELQEKFHKKLPRNHQLYNELHALLVEEGKK